MSRLAKQPTAPAHVQAQASAPSTQYPPGYFTALCVRDGWPYKGWKPSEPTAEELRHRQRSMDGHANSRAAVGAGKLGSITLSGTPYTPAQVVDKLRNWRLK